MPRIDYSNMQAGTALIAAAAIHDLEKLVTLISAMDKEERATLAQACHDISHFAHAARHWPEP